MSSLQTPVLIAGAGPVGTCIAIEMARRGIPITVIESRARSVPPSAKCNTVASRTLEVFRRFGVAEQVRRAGLPDDFPTDVLFCTAIGGQEMTRIPLPSRLERKQGGFADSHWRTAETQVRVSQLYLEPILAELMHRTPGVTAHYETSVEHFEQDEHGVTVHGRLADGREQVFRCHYLVGADGGRSSVRKGLGARLLGDAEIAHTRSTLIRAPGLRSLFGDRRPAWMSWVANHKVRGNVVAIDGRDLWLVHRSLPYGERDFEKLDRDQSLRDVLGVGPEFSYEVVNHEDWVGRRMVADRLRQGRVFLAGDAAHLWVPFAGYGMNAGIADAMNLSWLLAAQLEGWAHPAMLDAYEAERHPITEQVSKLAMQSMLDMVETLGRNAIPQALSSRFNPAGLALRKVMGAKLNAMNVPQFAPEGLNFGYFYDASPIIAYDDEPPPAYTMGSITPSTAPGCRMPHFWLPDGRSVYDELGPGYTLIRFDPACDVQPLLEAAAAAAMPIKPIDLPLRSDDAAFRHALLLVRQDQHVAWRGQRPPADCTGLVRRLCGHAAADQRQAPP